MIPTACSFLPVTHTKIALVVLCGSLTALMEEDMEDDKEQRNVENIWS